MRDDRNWVIHSTRGDRWFESNSPLSKSDLEGGDSLVVRTPKNIQVQYLDRMYKNSDHRVVNANGEFQVNLEALHFGFERTKIGKKNGKENIKHYRHSCSSD